MLKHVTAHPDGTLEYCYADKIVTDVEGSDPIIKIRLYEKKDKYGFSGGLIAIRDNLSRISMDDIYYDL